MSHRLSDKISTLLLPSVRAPGQYIGGEINQIRKQPEHIDTTVALAFPDTYAIGMSHLGLSILYAAVNQMPHVAAERVFCPWLDAVETMRQNNIELFSWESRRPVRQFDILGITLQHELAYSNVLMLLDLAGITFRAVDRHEDEPLVIGGGPIADCCEPVADFFDAVILGDGEEAFPAVIDAYRQLRRRRASRRDTLGELARQFPYVYVPQLFNCQYADDGTLASCEPTETGLPHCIERAVVTDLDNAVFPTAPVVPFTETTHDRIAIEIMRGCPQRCAFCHAAHSKGPVRYRSVDNILDIAWRSYLATGHDTVSLLSLSSSDYPHLAEVAGKLYDRFAGCHVGISLPSLRVDQQLRDVPRQVTGTRREGLTIAVEAASDRIRRAIGKRITDTDLFETMRSAYAAGWQRVKLYYMVGLPGETPDDIEAICDLTAHISQLRREVAGGAASINAAVSWLVPKPHTPFAWLGQQTADYFNDAKARLLDAKHRYRLPIRFKFHHLQRSLLEAALARGDRRLSSVLEVAYRNGARFDAWDECFDHARYQAAFEHCGLDPTFYAHRDRGPDERLPWDHLAGGNRAALYRRLQAALQTLAAAPAEDRPTGQQND